MFSKGVAGLLLIFASVAIIAVALSVSFSTIETKKKVSESKLNLYQFKI